MKLIDDKLQQKKVTIVIFVAISILAILIRINIISTWPLEHDESVHLLFSWRLAEMGQFRYHPWRHGPLLYYISALVLPLAEWGHHVARGLVVTLSMSAFLGLYWLRNWIGNKGAVLSSLLFAVHYYTAWISTYYRNDGPLLGVWLCGLAVTAFYIKQPTVKRASAIGIVIAVAFSLKEVTFILGFAAIVSAMIWYLLNHGFTKSPIIQYWNLYAWPLLPIGGFAFILTMGILFTGWPPSIPRIVDAPARWLLAIEWWSTPSKISRARIGTFRYISFLLRTPILILVAIVGGAIAIVRRHLLGMILAGTGTLFFVLHSFYTKQPPRFVVYMITPSLLLVGIAWEEISNSFVPKNVQKYATLAMVLIATVSAVGLPAQAVGGEPPSAYDRGNGWGLDKNQSEVVDKSISLVRETNCGLHIASPRGGDGAINHNNARWLYREVGNHTPGDIGYIRDNNGLITHGRWTSLENATSSGRRPIILSLKQHNVSYSTEEKRLDKWWIMKPEIKC